MIRHEVIFLENNTFLANAERLVNACTHYFCPACGTVHAQALVDRPEFHSTRQIICASCWMAGRTTLNALPTLSTEYLFEDIFFPLAILRRDFLLLTHHLDSP